jgi:hypothetical protein
MAALYQLPVHRSTQMLMIWGVNVFKMGVVM